MAFGSNFEDDKHSMSDINMTPLVDVMLVLLIIFIIAVPVITHSVKVDLPHANNLVTELKSETINLSISSSGDIYWNETLINNEVLETRLRSEASKQPQPEIHIRGDRNVEYQYVLNVMAAAQRTGLFKLGFVSDPQ